MGTRARRRPQRQKRLQGPHRELALLAGGLVLAMSTWFSTSAVIPALRAVWLLNDGQAAWLVIVVQIGFIAGALFSMATGLADRVPPRRLILIGAIAAAAANMLVVIGASFAISIVGRFLTGAALAFVYPPALKSMSSWFKAGRGFALGVMLGAIALGSAIPHLVNAVGGLGWRQTLTIVSVLTVIGGLIADRLCSDGPHMVSAGQIDFSQIKAVLANRDFRLASAGYFGHMWELYAMWAWIAAFYGDVFESSRVASLAAFAVVGVGAPGSAYAGYMSDKYSRNEAAALAMRWSASVAVVAGFLTDAPVVIVLGLGLIWGFWVVADSAQFSVIVTEVVDRRCVGTALTIQVAAGFTLTVFTIFLVPIIRDAFGWGWAFLMLAPGPVLGALAMRALRLGPRKLPRYDEPEPTYISPFF